MVLKLHKISIMPFTWMVCGLHTAAGALLGALAAGISLATNNEEIAMGLGPWAMLAFPLVNSVLGFCAGIFIAWCYNFFAEWSGRGIEFEFNEL